MILASSLPVTSVCSSLSIKAPDVLEQRESHTHYALAEHTEPVSTMVLVLRYCVVGCFAIDILLEL